VTSEYGAGSSTAHAVGVGTVGVGDGEGVEEGEGVDEGRGDGEGDDEGEGDAAGRVSVAEQPEKIRDSTIRKEMIRCFRDIVDPFIGFDHKATLVRISMPPNGWR